MFNADDKKAQAATELAVFGAILIFLIGTIVRTALSNSYTQNQNFKAMRMAMLASWTGASANPGFGASQNTSHNSSQVLFVEDRLDPDFGKYGDLDRNPFVAEGAGTFSYNLLYPLSNSQDITASLPVMDVYINGQHFPFTLASYVPDRAITAPGGCTYPNGSCLQNQCLRNVREWVGGSKLFYTLMPNPGGGAVASTFSVSPPACDGAINDALCQNLPLKDYFGNPTADGYGATTNVNAVMQFDLQRNADYSTTTGVLSQFPTGPSPNMRNYIAWQWAATAGTTAASIGLSTSNNIYPQYDIDGRLKEVTIYGIWQDSSGTTHVAYEDPSGGDIDSTWDSNTCGPQPGLQQKSQVFTFTKNGTYLEIKEGKLYDPETGIVVRSANKRDTIDLVQRIVQLSNNTNDFCDASNNPIPPVEVCVRESAPTDNCFTQATIAQTCYDTLINKIFVRSRLEDRRGRFWMTDTSGQLQVH